jgi:hypothetical protein
MNLSLHDFKHYWVVADIYGTVYLDGKRFATANEAWAAAESLPEYRDKRPWERPGAHYELANTAD